MYEVVRIWVSSCDFLKKKTATKQKKQNEALRSKYTQALFKFVPVC